jgi:hypothetical protein
MGVKLGLSSQEKKTIILKVFQNDVLGMFGPKRVENERGGRLAHVGEIRNA